jgi:DNA polymerase III alpha subunit
VKELLTELNDRVLRFDGVSIVEADQLDGLLRRGAVPSQLRVLFETPEIAQFNACVADVERLKEFSEEPVHLKFNWKLPPEVLSLDVEQHVSAVFGERLPFLKYDSTQTEAAINRVALELKGFEQRGLYDLLRTIIFVLQRFKETGQVWGVGRGSSCASFVLFLLGLHVVDPIKFSVPIEEFMHD